MRFTAAHITLDGRKIESRLCKIVDEESGWIVGFALDEKGKFIIDHDKPKLERKHGEVRITFVDDTQAV